MANQQTVEHCKEAAKHHEAGNDEKAEYSAHVTYGHYVNAINHAEKAAKQHVTKHT